MLNTVKTLLFLSIVFLLFNSPLEADSTIRINRILLEVLVNNSDLVIKGEVVNVENRLIDGRKRFGPSYTVEHVEWPVTELTVNVESVIAGEYDKRSIKIILPEGEYHGQKSIIADYCPFKPNVGDRIIIGLGYNLYGYGLYRLYNRPFFFRIDEGSLIPYMKEASLNVENPIRVIEEKAEERKFEEIYKSADIICIATVVGNQYLTKKSKKLVITIDEIIKGEITEPSIVIDGSNLFKSFFRRVPGYSIFVFLYEDNSTYKVVSGINGIYRIENSKLIRAHHAPLLTTVKDLKDKVSIFKEIYE